LAHGVHVGMELEDVANRLRFKPTAGYHPFPGYVTVVLEPCDTGADWTATLEFHGTQKSLKLSRITLSVDGP
jgi:hypothetical protein